MRLHQPLQKFRDPIKNNRRHQPPRKNHRQLQLEKLEDRTAPTVSILNGGGSGFAGDTNGGDPPDIAGAAGPSSYIEVSNNNIQIYNKATGAILTQHGIYDFFYNATIGNETQIGGGANDSTMIFDNLMGRFIIEDLDANGGNNTSQIVLAVSKSSNPTTLTTADWNFYHITTTQTTGSGTNWTDYPGNPGFNADAVVFTFNLANGCCLTGSTEIVSIDASDLANGVSQASLHTYQNFINGTNSYRPTTMHDSAPGDPMWLIRNPGDGNNINVTRMDNVLSNSATIQNPATSLPLPGPDQFVAAGIGAPLNPDSTQMNDIDTRILKAAEYNNIIVATHKIAVGTASVVSATVQVNKGVPQGGTGYTVGDTLTVNGGMGTAATLTVNSVDAFGSVTSVTVANPGNYSSLGGIDGSVSGGTGNNAKFNIFFRGELDVQWYAIDVSGTPTFQLVGGAANVGRIGFGPNTYAFDPAIDINAGGQIGLTYMQSDTVGGAANAATGGFGSMFVTARQPSDAAGTMQPSVLVSAGTGSGNITDRVGDFSGINVDPVNGTFWAVNEIGQGGNPGTAIANFTPGAEAFLRNGVLEVTVPTAGDNITLQPFSVLFFHFTEVIDNGVVLGLFLNGSFSSIHVFAFGGNDSLAITDNGGSIGLDFYNGIPIRYDGGSGNSVLLDDSTANFSDTYTVTSNTVSRPFFGGLTYSGVQNLTLNTETGNVTVNIESTSAATTVNLGNGTDTVNITPTSQVVDGIQATINGGVASSDTLNINDQANTLFGNWSISGSNVTRTSTLFFPPFFITFTGSVNYSNIGTVTINGGSGSSQFNLSPTAMNLDELPLINLHGTGSDTAVLNDQNNSNFSTWSVTGSSVTRTWVFFFLGIPIPITATVNYTGLSNLTLNGGSGGSEFDLSPTANFLGELPTINLHGGGGSNTAVLNDQTNAAFSTWSVTGSSVARTWELFFFGFFIPITNTVNYSGLTSLVLNGGSGGSEFDLSPTAMNLDELPLINLHGGGGSNTAVLNDQNNPNFSTWSVTGSSVTRTWNFFFFTLHGIIIIPITSTVNYTGLTSLVLNGGSGGNDFEVSPTANNLDELPGSLTVNGGGSSNTLNVYDQSNLNSSTWNIGSSSLNRTWFFFFFGIPIPVTRAINYSSLTSLGVHGGGNFFNHADNTFNITGTPASTSLDTGIGTDQVNVQASANPLSINGDSGTDTVTLGSSAPSLGGTLSSIAGPVSVSNHSTALGSLFTGQTTLVVDDSGDGSPRTATLTNSSLTGLGPVINYTTGEVTNLQIHGGSGGNTFNVLSTGAGTTTSIDAGNGLHSTNTVTIGSLAPSLGGTLANIAGPISVSNTSGSTALIVDDSGDLMGKMVTITNSSIMGLAPATITYTGGAVSSLTILGGSGGNTFNVQSTASGTPVSLNAGSGTDVVNVGNGLHGVQDIQGALAIEGPAVTLTVDDSANSTPRNATLDTFIPGGETLPFGRITGLAPAAITYELADTASPITIKGGSGGNTFTILSTGSQTLNLSSGAGSDIVSVQAISGPLDLNGQAGSDTVTLGSVAPAIGGVLANLNGVISISNPSGATALTIDDSVDPVNRTTATITSSSTTGLSPFAINYANLSSLTIDGGSGKNIYNVQSTAAGTSVILNAGSGSDDKVNVGSGGGTSTLNGIQGALTVNSQTGLTTLNINDQGSPGQTYTLTASTLSRSGAALITYDPVVSLVINAGGNDTLTVVSTAFGTPVTFKGGGGTNTLIGPNFPSTFNITSNNGGTVGNVTFSSVQNLVGGSADDIFKFSAGKGVTGTINGGGGTNTLDYSLYTTGVNVNLSGGTATGTGGVSNIQNVTGSPKNDTIVGIAGSVIRGNGGLDTLSGGPNDTFILAATQLAGTSVTGSGSGNTLIGANIANTWVLNAPGGGTLNLVITFTGIANLTGGSGIDKFQFLAGGSVAGTIDGAGGSNTLDYSLFGGPIAVNLQTSAATGTGGFLHIGTLAGSGNIGDMLTGPNVNSTWTLTGAGTGTVGSFHFSAIANLTGGTGADTFKFMPGGSVAGSIDGGAGSNKLDYSANGGPIAVTLTGPASGTASGYGFANIQTLVGSGNALDMLTGPNTTNLWNITNPNAGNINSTFNFSKIANLVGGTGVDVFKIATAGSISGNINGGLPSGQGDWLDYSANAKLITVNLATGTATSVGTVSNIQNVFGGNGGDNLTGDAQGNILIGGNGNDVIQGGTGRSLLIGGKGNDLVTGGSGGDILIGGNTTYDQTHNLAALASILAEWQSTDTYAQRVADIKTGTAALGGQDLNGANTLVLGTTVKDDGSFNTLTGGINPSDLDWFFKGIHDTLVNQEGGEQVN